MSARIAADEDVHLTDGRSDVEGLMERADSLLKKDATRATISP
jgi:hypothetical protein